MGRLVLWVGLWAVLGFNASAETALTQHARRCISLLDQTSLSWNQADDLLQAVPDLEEVRFRVITLKIGRRVRTAVLAFENHWAKPKDLEVTKPVVDGYKQIAVENGVHSDTQNWSYRTRRLALLLTRIQFKIEEVFTGRTAISTMALARGAKRRKHDVINIEADHRPQFSEEVHLMVASSLVFGQTLSMFTGLIYLLSAALVPTPVAALTSAAMTGGVYLAIDLGLRWVETFEHRLPLARNRDETVARNINGLMRGAHGVLPTLIILGGGHERNVMEQMTTRYGFREVTLP